MHTQNVSSRSDAGGKPSSVSRNSSRRISTSTVATIRWGKTISKSGFTIVPNLFLSYYRSLGIEFSEAMLILQLMSLQRRSNMPNPTFIFLSKRMGVTDHSVRAYARSLENKGFLKRVDRGPGKAVGFDLSPLFTRLEQIGASEQARQSSPRGAGTRGSHA